MMKRNIFALALALTLWCDHDHTYIFRRDDKLKMDAKAMAENKGMGAIKMRGDFFLKYLLMKLIWHHKND